MYRFLPVLPLLLLCTPNTLADHTENPTPVVVLEGHTDHVLYVAFSPDGKKIATAGENTVSIWTVE